MATTYIFYVHSNITIYLVKHYILLHKIPSSDILILFDRLSSSDVEVLPGKKFLFSEKIRNIHLNYRNFWPSFEETRDFINSEVKNKYIFFVPHILTESLQLFASNKKCKKVVYIEEGDMSYFSEDLLKERFCHNSFRANFFRTIYSYGMLYKKHPFPKIKKKVEAICLHQDAFPSQNLLKHIYNFKDVFLDENLKLKEDYDNCVIFLLDPFYPKEEEEKENYYNAMRRTFVYIKDNLGSKIYFKPHPVLSNNTKQIASILEIASDCELKGVLINRPVELIIANFKNVKVVTHFSSLIRYCLYMKVKPLFWGIGLIKDLNLERPKPMVKFLFEKQLEIEVIDG